MIKIINCVLAVLVSVGLTGCSTVQNNELYQDWQQHAYSVYNMPTPQGGSYATVANSKAKPPNTRGSAATARTTPPKVSYERLSEEEQNYIASHYGL